MPAGEITIFSFSFLLINSLRNLKPNSFTDDEISSIACSGVGILILLTFMIK